MQNVSTEAIQWKVLRFLVIIKTGNDWYKSKNEFLRLIIWFLFVTYLTFHYFKKHHPSKETTRSSVSELIKNITAISVNILHEYKELKIDIYGSDLNVLYKCLLESYTSICLYLYCNQFKAKKYKSILFCLSLSYRLHFSTFAPIYSIFLLKNFISFAGNQTQATLKKVFCLRLLANQCDQIGKFISWQ